MQTHLGPGRAPQATGFSALGPQLSLLNGGVHQRSEFLRLKGKGMHLQLGMPGLDLQRVRQILCLCKLMSQCEAGISGFAG